VSAQVVPVNANVPVNVLSDTPAQEVTQSNRAYAGGAANNTAAIHQAAPKAHKGKDAGTTTQTATNTQILPIAAAPAVAAQVVPVNANVPVNLFTTGTPAEDGTGEAEVSQANNAYAGATAANTTAADQRGTGTQTATNTQVLPISLAPALSPQLVPVNANIPVTVGNPLAVLPLPVDPLALLGDPVGTLTGLTGSLPLGAVTGLVGNPLGTVTGLAGSLPLGAVTGLVGNPLGTVTGLAGSLPLGAVTGLVGGLPLGAVTGLLPVGLPI
jgi:hypothetical protein